MRRGIDSEEEEDKIKIMVERWKRGGHGIGMPPWRCSHRALNPVKRACACNSRGRSAAVH